MVSARTEELEEFDLFLEGQQLELDELNAQISLMIQAMNEPMVIVQEEVLEESQEISEAVLATP